MGLPARLEEAGKALAFATGADYGKRLPGGVPAGARQSPCRAPV